MAQHCSLIKGSMKKTGFTLIELLAVAAIVGLLFATVAGEIVRRQGGSRNDVWEAQAKWFLLGFGIVPGL